MVNIKVANIKKVYNFPYILMASVKSMRNAKGINNIFEILNKWFLFHVKVWQLVDKINITRRRI